MPWQVLQRVDHPDPKAANAEALNELENGATGLGLVLRRRGRRHGYGLDAAPDTIERVLDGVELDAGITIDFNPEPGARVPAVRTSPRCVQSARQLRRQRLAIACGLDPIGDMARTGAAPLPWQRAVASASPPWCANCRDKDLPGLFAVADGARHAQAGGAEAQELAFVIAADVDYLRALEANGVCARYRARHRSISGFRPAPTSS